MIEFGCCRHSIEDSLSAYPNASQCLNNLTFFSYFSLFSSCLLFLSLLFSPHPSTPSAMDCVLSEWSEWSECNKSCGKGHMIRTRMVKMEPQFGGMACPETVQRKKCKIRKCTRGGANSDERRRRKEARERRRSSKQGREEGTEEHTGG